MDFNPHVWVGGKDIELLTTSGLRVVVLPGMTFIALKFTK